MTDHEFHKQLLELTAALARAASAKPYDPDAYKDIIYELNMLSQMTIRKRRVSPMVMNFVCLAAILFVLYLIYFLICEGFFL